MTSDADPLDISRRTFARVGAGVLPIAFAGCTGAPAGETTDGGDDAGDESEDSDGERQPRLGTIASFEVTPTEARQGQPLTVTASISNADDVAHNGNVTISIGGESVFDDRVPVEAGDTETITMRTQRWRPGAYDVSVVLSAGDQELDSARTTVDIRSNHDHFVDVSGTNFVLDGDQVFYNGAHADGLSTQRTSADEPGAFEYEYEDAFEGEHYVAEYMQYADSLDAHVLRIVVAGVPYWEDSTVHDAPGEFNEAWFELMDAVVAEAKRNGIRLVISLMSHDDTFAPAPGVYASWSDTVADDLNTNERNDAFFGDEQANGYFKNFIERIVTRENRLTGTEYREDPTIMMWECGNEIDYWTAEHRGESLADWYDDIASYIKSLDDNHLVTTGMYGSDARNEFVEDHQSDAIDVCSFHFYPKFPNGPYDGDTYRDAPATDRSIEEMQTYIERKVRTAHDELGKPVMLGEFGVPQFPDIYGWTLATRRRFFDAMYDTADRVDLDGVHAFALTLDKKFTGETRITNGRYENGIYPDDEMGSVIRAYGDVVRKKSEASVAGSLE